jgi:pyruvate dehydrogenase E2 component (dihydrolipoamide acetyltransferase)
MPADVIMPALGMAQETGKILRWLKQDGDAVAKGEPLLEVETDKVTVEIEAPADGTLAGVRVPEGEEVPVGTVIAVVLGEGEAHPVTQPPRRRLASPKARRLAHERGIDLDAVTGTGPNGAVVAGDIERLQPALKQVAVVEPGTSSVWRTMAERTQRAWQEVPHFVLWRDVDASRLISWREVSRETVSHTDQLVKICAEALRRHPNVNAGYAINIAIAVATDDGLVAPVVHDADTLDLAAIAARRREIVEAARAGTLRPHDVQGGTFTISNLGMFGVDGFQAIVNAPQAAILAVGRIAERPWALRGELVVRPVLTLSVSFDHRVVDGARGAEFLDTLASLVEEPAGLVA